MPVDLGIAERLARLCNMSMDEVGGRLNDSIRKRGIELRGRLGLAIAPSVDRLLAPGDAPPSRFFFSPEEREGICSAMKHDPAHARSVIARADRICDHRFDLLGYSGLSFGAVIDWSLDPVHQKRVPLRPYYRIRYLDDDVAGDVKIIWELNRHQHFIVLGRAFCLTGEQRYADEFVAQFYDWQRQNPYALGINWASALEVALRSLSWLWAKNLFAGAAMPAALCPELTLALGRNACFIERNLSTWFSPNTHLLGEALALFAIGVLCPELVRARILKQLGWKVLLAELKRQVRPDGGYFEQSTYYHVYALDILLHARMLAVRNQIAVPADFDPVLVRMLDYLAALSSAGPPPMLGDDDGGRLFDPQRNRAEHLRDPLSTGAVLFRRADWKRAAGSLSEETLWLLGADAAQTFIDLGPAPAARSRAFLDSGIFISAAEGTQLTLDAGPLGSLRGGHGHADALSVTISVAGREWLRDPGTSSYVSSQPWRDLFRSTSFHNTLLIDGQGQATPAGPFAWRDLPNVVPENWTTGEDFDLFIGSHSGYRRLPFPVVHRRLVFFARPYLWLVVDIAEGSGRHDLEINWHAAEPAASGDTGFRIGAAGCGISLHPLSDPRWTFSSQPSWIAPRYGEREAATVLRGSASVNLPADFATLITASPDASDRVRLERLECAATLLAYRCIVAGFEHKWVLALDGQAWSLGNVCSNARMLYWRCGLSDGALEYAALCHGSYAKFSGQHILQSSLSLTGWEFNRKPSAAARNGSEPAAVAANLTSEGRDHVRH